MSVRMMDKVWNTTLPTAEKMVLLVIADHANDNGTNAWPGIATIARKTSMSTRTVQRHIKTLEQSGLIDVVVQGGGNKDTRNDRRPNRYDIVLSALNGVTIGACDIDGVTNETSRGDNQDITGCQLEHNGVTRVSPYPSLEPSIEPSEKTKNSQPATLSLAIEQDVVDDGFDAFWALYPRRVEKKDARKVWLRLKDADKLCVMEALPLHVAFWEREKTAVKFIPHPATWLNGRRWEDELSAFTGVEVVRSRSAPGMGVLRHIINYNNEQGELG